MFVSYKVANVLSFDDPVCFSMMEQRKTKRHTEHVTDSAGVRCLRGAAIYGANASGKSNLVRSMSLIRQALRENDCTILSGHQFAMRVPVRPVMKWEIAFTGEDSLFVYSVGVDNEQVVEESLRRIDAEDEMVFSRTTEKGVFLGDVLLSDRWFDGKVRRSAFYFRKVIEDGLLELPLDTPAKALFASAYKAFRRIEIVDANSTARPDRLAKKLEVDAFKSFVRELMKTADVGITDIRWNPIPLNSRVAEIAKSLVDEKTLKRDGAQFSRNGNSFFSAIVHDGKTEFFELRFVHGDMVMRASDESDGTLRLLEYSLFLYSLRCDEMTWVVDEIDRSLHPYLTRFILRESLQHMNSKSQLIITTHDTTQLTQENWRTDEVWFTEKRPDGSTDLYSLYQFRPRYDVDIEKGYMEGRWGAVPYLGKRLDEEFAHD